MPWTQTTGLSVRKVRRSLTRGRACGWGRTEQIPMLYCTVLCYVQPVEICWLRLGSHCPTGLQPDKFTDTTRCCEKNDADGFVWVSNCETFYGREIQTFLSYSVSRRYTILGECSANEWWTLWGLGAISWGFSHRNTNITWHRLNIGNISYFISVSSLEGEGESQPLVWLSIHRLLI